MRYPVVLLFLFLFSAHLYAVTTDTTKQNTRYYKSISLGYQFGKVLLNHDFLRGDNPNRFTYDNFQAFSANMVSILMDVNYGNSCMVFRFGDLVFLKATLLEIAASWEVLRPCTATSKLLLNVGINGCWNMRLILVLPPTGNLMI